MGDVGDADCSGLKKGEQKKQPTACILCTILLVGLLILVLILYFALFKPKDPTVQVPTMQLLSFSSTAAGAASSSSYASISLRLQVSMYNPNRADFIIQQGSTACLYFQNQQVGFAPIPPGTIPAQSFSTCSITISTSSPIPLVPTEAGASGYSGGVPSYSGGAPYYADAGDRLGGGGSWPSDTSLKVSITSSVTIVGHVTTANVFSHHADVVSKCQAALSLGSPKAYIQSYTCQSSYSLDD